MLSRIMQPLFQISGERVELVTSFYLLGRAINLLHLQSGCSIVGTAHPAVGVRASAAEEIHIVGPRLIGKAIKSCHGNCVPALVLVIV
jgi:hypothetical protein